MNFGPVLENIVYNYARSRNYEISIGRLGTLGIDFICRDILDNYSYIQVARTIDNDNFDESGKNLTEEREYRPLENIRDAYPKYVLTMDKLLQNRSGVKHLNIVKTLLRELDF